MGDKGRVRTALVILGVTMSLMSASAFDPRVRIPDGFWPVALLAAGYLFASGMRNGGNGNGNGNGNGRNGRNGRRRNGNGDGNGTGS